MRTRIDSLVVWSRSHQGRKLIRFTSVSVISTLTSQFCLFILFNVIGLGVIESTVLANVIATVPSYNLNRRWSWGKSGKSHLVKEIIPFWVISALGIGTSFFGSLIAKGVVNAHKYPHVSHAAAWPKLGQWVIVAVANFGSFGIFWVLKLMVFNKIFKASELDEMDEHLTHEEEVAHQGGTISP